MKAGLLRGNETVRGEMAHLEAECDLKGTLSQLPITVYKSPNLIKWSLFQVCISHKQLRGYTHVYTYLYSTALVLPHPWGEN